MGVAEVFQRVEEVVVRHESELAEAGMGEHVKVVMREDAEEFLTAHLFGISPDATQHAQQFRALAVLHRGDILEIIGTAIAPVTVEMIYLVPNGFPVSVTDRFGSRTYPRECHERVAVHAVEMPHNGVLGAADAVGRAPSFSSDGRERGLHLMHDAPFVGDLHVVYAVELALPTAIERFVGGASSDDRAVRQS